MAVKKNTSDLLAQAASTLPDNTTQQITPKDSREMSENIAFSSFNKITDTALVGLKEYSIIPTYEAGQGCINGGSIYISNKVTGPGVFAPADWDILTTITPAQASAITANTAKVTNATHTGEVTGSGALTVQPTLISGKTVKSTLAGTEEILVNDGGTFKKVLASSLGGGATEVGAGTDSIQQIGATASSANSVAIGFGSNVNSLADNGVALGQGAIVQGVNAMALGLQSEVRGTDSLSVGFRAKSGVGINNSITIGSNSRGNGSSGIALGVFSKSGVTAIGIGSQAEANGLNSIAIGQRLRSSATGSFFIGYSNVLKTNSTSNSLEVNFNETTSTFRIGKSVDSWINTTANFGIGETTPTAKLHVKGAGSTSGTTALLVQNSLGTDLLEVKDDGTILGNLPNIYTLDGTLSSNRTISMAGNDLTFDGGNFIIGKLKNESLGSVSYLSNSSNSASTNQYGLGLAVLDTSLNVKSGGAISLSINNAAQIRIFSDGRTRIGNGTTAIPSIADPYGELKLYTDGSTYLNGDVIFRDGQNIISLSNLSLRSTNYALKQLNTGEVSVNSGIGTNLLLGTEGNTRITITNTGVNIKGSGSTSATTALLVQNSLGTDLLEVKDDGTILGNLPNIYGVNGTLTSNRTISMAGNSFTFDASGSGGDNVYMKTGTNVNKGINLFGSSNQLRGRIITTNTGNEAQINLDSLNAPNKVLLRTSGTNWLYNSLNVGEGNASGSIITVKTAGDLQGFHVVNNTNNNKNVLLEQHGSGASDDGRLKIGYDVTKANNYKIKITSLAQDSYIDNGANFGFGTDLPTAKLHVKGAGSTAVTTALLVQNSLGTDLLEVKDDGTILGAFDNFANTDLLFAATRLHDLDGNRVNLDNGIGLGLIGGSNLGIGIEAKADTALYINNPPAYAYLIRNTTAANGELRDDGIWKQSSSQGSNIGIGRASGSQALAVRNNSGASADAFHVFDGSNVLQHRISAINGGTMAGYACDMVVGSASYTAPRARLEIYGSTTAKSALHIRSGVAPTTPINGDVWFDGTNLNIRISGVTRTVNIT